MADPDFPPLSDVAGGGEDEYWPPRVKLHQFDPEAPRSVYELECILDAWVILQRSAVDAAALPASERNIFAFSEACIYFATVHDADFEAREARRKKKGKENKEEEKGERPEGNAEANAERQGLFPDYMQGPENYFQRDAAVSNTHDALASDERDDTNITGPLHEQGVQIDAQNPAILNDAGDEDLTNINDTNQQASSTSSSRGNLYDIYWRTGPFEFPPAAVPNQYTESTPKVNPKMPKSDFIGIVYLVPTAGPAQEVSIGLALLPHARGQGFGSVTVKRVLATAFDIFKVHRVSAGVLGPSPNIIARRPLVNVTKTAGGGKAIVKESAASGPDVEARLKVSGTETDTEAGLRMFVGLGFSLEGTRRRAVPDMHDNGSWRDAHYLAMLNTDWLAQQRAALAAFIIDQAQSKSKGKGKGKSTSMVSDSDDAPESRNGNSKAERARDAWKDQRRTRWDEMLTRHQREQETLARVEARLQRSASMETLRPTGSRDELVEVEIGFGSMTDGTTSGYSSSVAGDGELEGEKIRKETERESFTVASPPRSSTSTSAYSLSDPAKDFDMARHRASGAGDGSRYFSDDESENEVDYGEETVQSKVLRFLGVRPPPGTPPPPSDVEDNSDFESCVDDLYLSSDRETSATPGTEMVPHSVNENMKVNEEANGNTMGPLATSINSVAALNLRQKQSRKRRRLSNDLIAVEDSGHVEADDASFSGSIPPPRLPYTGSDSTTFALVRSGMDSTLVETSQLHATSRARTQGGSPNSEFQFVDADFDMDMDSHSDAETAYTVSSTSTWEVVSDGRAAGARIPTPLTSLRALSSGTGLSNLKGTTASEDE